MKHIPTQLGEPFEVTIDEVVQEKLRLLQLKDGETLIDLGCGDARTLIAAAELANVRCIGYELRPKVLEAARKNVEASGLSDRIEIIEADFFNADLSVADVLILYLTRNSLGQLSFKFDDELTKGTRVITHDFDIPSWDADQVLTFKSKNAILFTFYMYTVK